jgi:enamine deaminase RidA (YjgF/YER057c/UK114 family)
MNAIARRHIGPRMSAPGRPKGESRRAQREGSPVSKIVRHGGGVYLCGQTAGGTTITDVSGQTAEVLRRIDSLLAEIGSDKSRLLAATIYLKEIQDSAAMNSVWEAWMPAGCAPARTTVEAHLAAPELRVEITAVAAA